MAKCRMLLQENEDLGKMINSGRTAKLEGEIAMQKNLVQEMKSNQSEMEQLVGELEEDMEGLQSMVYALQRQLKETREQLARSQAENAALCQQLQSQSVSTSAATAASAPGGLVDSLPPPGGDRHLGTGPGGAGDARTSDAQAARTFSEDVDMETDAGGGTKGEEGGLREGEEEMEQADSHHPPLGGPGREAGQPLPDEAAAAARDCKGRTGGGSSSSNSTASQQQHFNHRGEVGRTGEGEEEAAEEGRTWEAREALDTGGPPSASAGDFTPPPLTNSDPASQLAGLGEKRTPLVGGEDVLEESDGTEPISNGVSTDPPTAPSESGEEGGQLSA